MLIRKYPQRLRAAGLCIINPTTPKGLSLGCVTDWQQETRGLFFIGRDFTVRDQASDIKDEVQELLVSPGYTF